MRTLLTTILAASWLLFSCNTWSAEFAKGEEAYNSGDYETALAEWQPLADSGDADAQFGIALLYANGFGVDLDDEQALKWYGLAAAQGHGKAQCNIAIMHANGWGVPQNDDEAFKWYSLAAESGIAAAQINLASMYMSGFGAEQDNIEAYKWFSIASELGEQQASYERDSLAERMAPEEKTAALGLVTAWLDTHSQVVADSQVDK